MDLTKTGQKLFQSAIESYVYCMLGAQAQIHWSIISRGAKSLQTKDIFQKLVKDTIAQDNQVKLISDMKLAIKDTNVVLNMAISPGIILIPSDMIILEKKLDEYNNVLTLATKDMEFGVNKDINYVESKKEISQTASTVLKETSPERDTYIEDLVYIFSAALTIAYGVARYVLCYK